MVGNHVHMVEPHGVNKKWDDRKAQKQKDRHDKQSDKEVSNALLIGKHTDKPEFRHMDKSLSVILFCLLVGTVIKATSFRGYLRMAILKILYDTAIA
jgi:hypothetical protein